MNVKRKYAFHPAEFAIGETEQFYEKMAARGWTLTKRGVYLSVFEPCAPCEMRFRIEVAQTLPEEQLTVYADCGWEHAASRGLLHVFRAPGSSGAPEFYDDPTLHGATLKALRKQYVWEVLSVPLQILFFLALCLMDSGVRRGFSGAPAYFAAQFRRELIENTAFYIALGFLLLWSMLGSVRGLSHICRLRGRMKRGEPLDHAPKPGRTASKYIRAALLCFAAVFGVLTAAQTVSSRAVPMPQETDAPYIFLADLGVEGERTVYNDRESDVHHSRSLLAERWDTFEIVDTGDGEEWLYQDVYRLKSPEAARGFAQLLMKDSVFDTFEEYEALEIPGLDFAWTTNKLECVAVKGELVCYAQCILYNETDAQTLLSAFAEKWK